MTNNTEFQNWFKMMVCKMIDMDISFKITHDGISQTAWVMALGREDLTRFWFFANPEPELNSISVSDDNHEETTYEYTFDQRLEAEKKIIELIEKYKLKWYRLDEEIKMRALLEKNGKSNIV